MNKLLSAKKRTRMVGGCLLQAIYRQYGGQYNKTCARAAHSHRYVVHNALLSEVPNEVVPYRGAHESSMCTVE